MVIAGSILGFGLGGFVDGIVLHQVLQWHHLLSAYGSGQFPTTTLEGLATQTRWDGVFHASTWLVTVIGIGVLWRAACVPGVRWSASAFLGAIVAGLGAFNLVDGIVNHHLLGTHHVRDDLGGPLAWDLALLAVAAGLVLAGTLLIRLGAGARDRPGE